MSKDQQIEQLKKMLALQTDMVEQLKKQMDEKDATILELRKIIDEMRSVKAGLEETLEEFRRNLFGVRSEKTQKNKDSEQTPEEAETPKKTITVKEHTRERKPKARREDLYANLPVREVLIPLSEEQRRCGYCNAKMQVIGSKFVREELRVTPAVVERVRYLQEIAVCPECRKDGDGTFAASTVPTALMPHSPASPSAAAYVMYYRGFLGLPYYRQEVAMRQLGLKLPRETMANWCIYCAEQYFYPIYDRMHCQLLKRDVIHADETTCQVLHEKGRAAESVSYMWIYVSGSDNLPKIVLYDYQPGRNGKYAKDFLEGFAGMLQCDGYQGYHKVEDVILVCCLAHCRRKFYEAIPAERRKKLKLLDIQSDRMMEDPILPKDTELADMIPGEVGLAYCNKLFYIERELKELDADERKRKREEKEQPIWNEFFKWLDGITPAGGSKLEKAVKYARNHRDTLCNYMLDGRCEISNNAAERCAKSYAIGRKASLFHSSEAGAAASAVMYSIIETAKSNQLNVFQYLYTVLLYMPDYKNEPAGIEKLLPWSDFIREHCSGLIDVENITPEKHDPLPL